MSVHQSTMNWRCASDYIVGHLHHDITDDFASHYSNTHPLRLQQSCIFYSFQPHLRHSSKIIMFSTTYFTLALAALAFSSSVAAQSTGPFAPDKFIQASALIVRIPSHETPSYAIYWHFTNGLPHSLRTQLDPMTTALTKSPKLS